MPDSPRVGVMVITMMRPDLINQCMEHILKNTTQLHVRLVNNGDRYRETHYICKEWEEYDNITYVNQPRQWPAQTRNDSMRWAVENNFKYLVFIDDDIVVLNNGITTLVDTMEENPDIYALSGKISQPGRQTRLIGGPLRNNMFYKLSDRTGLHYTDWVGGGYTIHRLEPLLLYDDEYETGWNDYDWSMMAKRDGHRLAATGDAFAWHRVKFTEEGIIPYDNTYEYNMIRREGPRLHRMRKRFESKWGFWPEGGEFEYNDTPQPN